MKLNWGTGILFVIIVFMSITIITVIFMMNQDIDLVTKDYYEKSITHQDQIESESRANLLDESIKIKFDGSIIKLIFPAGTSDKNISGQILFYRPSDSQKDFKLPLSLENDQQIIPVLGLEKGFWRIKLNWQVQDESYFNESSFTLN